MTTTSAIADRTAAALAVLARGLALFDLPPGEKRPESGWQQRTTTDPEQVRRWLAAGRNLGVGCRASAVVGLDLDRHGDGADGIASFEALCSRYGQPWPATLTTATPAPDCISTSVFRPMPWCSAPPAGPPASGPESTLEAPEDGAAATFWPLAR